MDPRRLLPPLVAVTGLVALATGGVVLLDEDPAPSRATPAAAPVPAHRAPQREVLSDWDDRRSRAWALGSVSALRDLYVPGSDAGRADVRMLRSYTARGLRVEGLATQVLELEVRVSTPRRMVLTVTDRVVGGEVVGARRTRLPTDRPTRRTVVFRQVAGEWLVAGVRPD